MNDANHRVVALEFLRLARDGDRGALEQLVTPSARHHSPYFSAGVPALLDAIEEAAKTAPGRTVDLKRVVADGEYVVVHSHIREQPTSPGWAVVHIFRFEDDRIAELWDVGQPVPEENPNTDGMF